MCTWATSYTIYRWNRDAQVGSVVVGWDHEKVKRAKAYGYEFVVGARRPDARVFGRTPRDLHSIPGLLARLDNVKNVSERQIFWLSLECRAGVSCV